MLFKNKDKQLFNDLMEYIRQKENDFSKNELRRIYFHLIGFCHLLENISEEAKEIEYYYELELSLYKYLIDSECLFKGESDAHLSYHNIVNACLMLKQYDFTREFILSFKSKLPPAKQEFHYNRELAKLLRREKKYAEAIKLLRPLSSNNLFIELDIRQSLLGLYFLNHQLEELEYFHAAFKNYLFRKKNMLPNYYFDLLNNYLIFIKRIFFFKLQLKLYDNNEYKQLFDKLYQQIQDTTPILHKDWLIRQLELIARERPVNE
ncbi:MAG: hypothetical protein A3K10_06305 [Bacteroidetes bacterium RIFCSPLOWO2_12_FULL_31_6]|nr:MAG: hypothetical protein A3K10_06305 [Bacteroidetes bacterium RIFCSPLOWO2_12_FULL_31_6]